MRSRIWVKKKKTNFLTLGAPPPGAGTQKGKQRTGGGKRGGGVSQKLEKKRGAAKKKLRRLAKMKKTEPRPKKARGSKLERKGRTQKRGETG